MAVAEMGRPGRPSRRGTSRAAAASSPESPPASGAPAPGQQVEGHPVREGGRRLRLAAVQEVGRLPLELLHAGPPGRGGREDRVADHPLQARPPGGAASSTSARAVASAPGVDTRPRPSRGERLAVHLRHHAGDLRVAVEGVGAVHHQRAGLAGGRRQGPARLGAGAEDDHVAAAEGGGAWPGPASAARPAPRAPGRPSGRWPSSRSSVERDVAVLQDLEDGAADGAGGADEWRA